MAEMTIEQRRALAVANARLRMQQNQAAGERQEAQANLAAMQEAGTAPAAPAPETYRGMVLPVEKDTKTGDWDWAVPRAAEAAYNAVTPYRDGHFVVPALAQGIFDSAVSAASAPGRAASGELPLTGPDGSTSPQAIEEAFNFAGWASPFAPGVRNGGVVPTSNPSLKTPKVEPPSADILKSTASRGYEKLRDLGVDYKTSAVNDLSGEIQANLTRDGITPSLAPKVYSILGGLAESPAGSVASLDGITGARRAFGHAAADFANPTEQLAAKRAMEALDGFLARSDPATVERGPASEVPSILADARGNYAAYKRSQTLTDLDDAAQLRASAANSGTNAGNTTRQRVTSLVLNDKKAAQFGDEDLAGLRGVVEGSNAANFSRWLGNMLGGGGLGATLSAGAGGIPGMWLGSPELATAGAVALPTIGRGAKEMSNILTERALKGVERETRKRSPLYEEMVKNAGKVPDVPEKTLAMVRAILLGSQPYQQGGGW